jgi:hypothetical protein
MKTALIAVAALALVAFAGAIAPNAALAQTNVCQANPSPPDSADPDIIVDSPAANATVTSPLTTTGQARTFESTVQVSLFDASGTEIASTFGMANAPDVGQLGPFSISLTFSVSADADACLWVYEDSAETGDPINVVQVPVLLEAAELPTTGGAQPDSDGLATSLLAAALLAVLGSVALLGAGLLRAPR